MQLMMYWPKQPLNKTELPAGFSLRTYQEGDTLEWIEICKNGLGTAKWSEKDFKKNMLEKEGISPEGIFNFQF